MFSIFKSEEQDYAVKGVYFIGIKGRKNTFKIGKSINCATRIKQLQTGNPDKLYFYKVIATDDHTNLETSLHRKFKHKRILNEWFKITKKEINNLEPSSGLFHKFTSYFW